MYFDNSIKRIMTKAVRNTVDSILANGNSDFGMVKSNLKKIVGSRKYLND